MTYLVLNTILYTSLGVISGPTVEVAKSSVSATVDGTVFISKAHTRVCFVTVDKNIYIVKSECDLLPVVIK